MSIESHTGHPHGLTGQVIGQRFVVQERLDSTGQANVFVAEHVLTHRTVALKVARCEAGLFDPVVARFQRVARVVSQVEHPACVRVLDFGVDDSGYAFLATERVQGKDLETVVRRDGPLTPEEVVAVGLQILEGLEAAHQRGILHGELQPRYVMVDGSEGSPSVKLLGFGLGEALHEMEQGGRRMRQEVARFAAPERLMAGQRVDSRADLFAAGAVLFYALTAELPWPEAEADPAARGATPARLASAVAPKIEIPPGLDRVLERALHPVAAARFAGAAEMAAALRRSLGSEPDEVSAVEAVHESFGRYKLLQQLATGGMGELYLASTETLPGLPKSCALKLLRPDLAEQKGYVDRFLDEARLAIQLAHPNLAAIYDVGKQDERFFMAMEYIAGKDCRRLLDRAREDGLKLPVEVALYIAREVADALAYAHRAHLQADSEETSGLVHRDVSPRNIVISYEGQVKLIDFGLAKQATALGRTETGVVMGKVAYMAPEQCLGEPVDRRVDIYAVGAVLYELLTGKRIREVTDFERLADLVRQPVTELAGAARPDLPYGVDDVLRKTLAVDPGERYAHAEALRDDLTEILSSLEPRMSRDRLAALMQELFGAERRADAERAQVPVTDPAPATSDSALLRRAGPAAADRAETRAMQVLAPDAGDVGGGDTLVDTASAGPLPPPGSKAGRASDGQSARGGASEEVVRAGAASRSDRSPGARTTLVVLLCIFFLLAGVALARYVLPRFLEPQVPRRTRRSALVAASPVRPARQRASAVRRPALARRRQRPREDRRLVARQVDAAVRRARAALFSEVVGYGVAALRARGVLPSDLVALPRLELPFERLRRAARAEDLAKTLDGLAALRAVLSGRKASCKRLRRAKYGWARRALRAVRKAAPGDRAARKAFLEGLGFADLRARLRELRRRAGDDKLTCAEKSLGYAKLIPDLVKALGTAKVPEARWHEGLEALQKAFGEAATVDGGLAPAREPARRRAREPARHRAREPAPRRAREPAQRRAREPARHRAGEPARRRAGEPTRRAAQPPVER